MVGGVTSSGSGELEGRGGREYNYGLLRRVGTLAVVILEVTHCSASPTVLNLHSHPRSPGQRLAHPHLGNPHGSGPWGAGSDDAAQGKRPHEHLVWHSGR